MEAVLGMTGLQHTKLKQHLFPGDGLEAAAIAICGRRAGATRHRLVVRKLFLLPYEQCIRTQQQISWNTDILIPILQEADRNGLSIVKFHSHPGDYSQFSLQDDESDCSLFASIAGWIEADVPHCSVVVLTNGSMFGRVVAADGHFSPLAKIAVGGNDIEFFYPDEFGAVAHAPLPEFMKRHAQAFGESTTRKLSRLSVAIVGCSGTGSFVIAMLAHLGVGRLVLVDHDIVKILNLNRILYTTADDAKHQRLKVDVIANAIGKMGLGTKVERVPLNLFHPDAVRAVAGCDIVFGCMDTLEGRFLLNMLATFYALPYFDVGVGLEADDHGVINQVCGYVRYLQPDRSSLLSRNVFTMAEVQAEGIKRQNPQNYENLRRAGYIKNVDEDRPAVISVNATLSSLAVNELLARLHGYRDEPNSDYATVALSLSQMALYPETEDGPCRVVSKHVGRGDVVPLLDQAELSEV
jgi:hypothetical protein